ncbi:MAG: efflux RND transporter periplasmic adaptor subunit [Bryobacteraceae bacterium]
MLDLTDQNEMTVDEKRQTEIETPPRAAPHGPKPRRVGAVALILLLVAASALGVVIYRGISSRTKATVQLARATDASAVPTVVVTYPKANAPAEEIVLPGNMQAYTDTPIYARTNGYLKRWYFDIGARVKEGQLLADIETPEIDQQLEQARADLATAQANYALAKTTADRWQFLLKSDSVSKQETDQTVGDMNAKKATVDSMTANVHRLEELKGFEKVYAPFSGVVTARNIDIGSLINAGANSAARELFHMAAIGVLRVYVSVPEVYSRAAKAGATATLTLDEFPGRVFNGKLVRNANAIDTASRTLLVEVDVNNPTGELLPGAYVSVHLKLPSEIRSVTIPSNALLFRQEGLRAAIVRDGRTVLVPIKIGRDYGHSVEVISGLRADEPVILNPADAIISGMPVHVKQQDSSGEAGK